MKIGDENFNKAVKIISQYQGSSCTVSFNVPVKDNYSNVFPIVLKAATPGLIEALIANEYSIGINDKGAYVDKY